MSKNIKMNIDQDGIAVIEIDVQDRPMNVITVDFADDFKNCVEQVLGDGYDVNRDGQIGDDEAFNNWMEYHVSNRILLSNESVDGVPHFSGFVTSLFNESWISGPTISFGQSASSLVEDVFPEAHARAGRGVLSLCLYSLGE